MDLILSVLADPSGANMLKHTKLFTPAGGSLGRADSNDWVLPDPERVVSSRHALITFSDNQYYLVDESTNGTYLNQAENPVGKGNRVPLNDGDILGIGDYQLKVTLRKPKADSGLPKGLGEADFLDSADRTTFSPAAAAKMQKQAEAQQLDSWLEPGASSAQSGEWGYVSSASPLSNEGLADPGSEVVDPLAALSPASGAAGGESLSGFGGSGNWEDDDWWKDGSEQDHAPADRHAMHFTTQQTPAPEAPPAQFAQSTSPGADFAQPVQPSAQRVQPPPAPPSPPQQPVAEADNPFAESFAVMQGQQVDGAPGFDNSPLGGFSTASQPFSQLQQPPAAEPLVQQVAAQNTAQIPQAPAQQVPPQAPAQQVPPQAPSQQVSVQQEIGHTGGYSGAGTLAQTLGLNLRPEQQPQVEQQAAEIVQETVTRLIDLLRARSSIKNELRVQRTVIQTEANNPLKFSATATDALSAMFAGNGAFMDPRTAVADSFDDLSDHQVAVLAGMRAGYEAMLKFFNPENIERRLNISGSVFASKNAKNWEGFVQMYKELARDPENCYRRLFGDEFASTYEHQLSELKNARNLKR